MYNLNNVNLDFLLGESIIQICFGKYITQFYLGENISISSGDEIIVSYLNKKQTIYPDKEIVDFSIRQLIGETVNKVEVEGDRNLILLLNDGIVLSFMATSDSSECYSINYKLGTIVI
ncbi:MAG: hypothetical protein ACM3O8_01735 [Methylococcaceae bacterium]